jgi:hypothetical protein
VIGIVIYELPIRTVSSVAIRVKLGFRTDQEPANIVHLVSEVVTDLYTPQLLQEVT